MEHVHTYALCCRFHKAIDLSWGAFWTVLDIHDWPYPEILMQRYRGAAVMMGMLPTGLNPRTKAQILILVLELATQRIQAVSRGGARGSVVALMRFGQRFQSFCGNSKAP